jgi:hypothetical protein
MDVKITDYPYRYKAFNLNVFSQIPVAGLVESDVQMPDIVILEGKTPLQLENPLNKGVLFQATENEFLLNIMNLGRIHLQNGDIITVERIEDTSWNEFSAFILGTVFGALLHQRHLLPLHGSSVVYKKKGLIFAGTSGAGKSTLAAAFIHKGARLLADDISLISFNGGGPMIVPAFPGMKIWEDSLKQLGKNPEKYRPIRKDLKKYLYPVDKYHEQQITVDHIFIISSHNRETFEIQDMQGIEKFNALKNNTYFFRGMFKTGILATHFQMCNILAQHVPVSHITRPNGSFRMDELMEKIIAKLSES